MIGKKHKELIEVSKSSNIMSQFMKSQSSSSCMDTSHSQNSDVALSSKTDTTISNFLVKSEVQNAEIIWALKCMKSHYSYKSSEDIAKLFKTMFPDSKIAAQFSCGEKKLAYLCCFGLAPHFQKILAKCFNEADNFTILFDETLNRSKQEKQMDILVKFWHRELNIVCTRYFTSVFMGHSTAQDILDAFYKSADEFDLPKLIQISMDGPAVNWAFYNLLQNDMRKNYGCEILNIGSCDLHILNNAFKLGESETDWDISHILSSMYYLFKDSPARRDDFLKVSKLKKFPLKFVKHRWLENVPCTERALEIWQDVICFIENVKKGSIKMKYAPKSFYVVERACKDILMPVKFSFFLSVAKILQPFLTVYQGDKPLLPFLATDILKLIKCSLNTYNVVKSDIVKHLTVIKICKYDFEFSDLSPLNEISTGFAGDKLLRELKKTKQLTEKQTFDIKSDCKKFIIKMVRKIIEKNSINYAIVRNLVCLDPRLIATSGISCISKLGKVLEKLSECKKINPDTCEKILLQFRNFIDTEAKLNFSDFSNFNVIEMRLDTFFTKYLSKQEYSDLWKTVKLLLILSHGQADVERGFSINKHIEIENLSSHSYISQKIIYDHIQFCGGIENVTITKELRESAFAARQRYLNYLEDQKSKRENATESLKRKRVEEELQCLTVKMHKTEKDINVLENCADDLAAEAETLQDLQRFMKSNNFRKQVKEKRDKLAEIKEQIKLKKDKLKN